MQQMEMHVNPLWQQYVPCILVDKGLILFLWEKIITTGACVSLLSIGEISRLHMMNND